jgi:glyoxylase-like metal-dependent hydrolase (beta-lactamase superfamily II)
MRNKYIFFIILAYACLILWCGSKERMQPLELYAVRYGSSMFSSGVVFDGDRSKRMLPFAWLFYVIKTGDKTVLVDTGTSDPVLLAKFRITLFETDEPLASIGAAPGSVTDIIITHAHFDHAGNIDKYPDARIYAHSAERSALREYCRDESRVVFFDDSYSFDKNISIRHVGGHTRGSSVVWLSLDEKSIVLTGDEAYLPENIQNQKGVGSVFNRKANLSFLKDVLDKKTVAYTFHDPSIVPEKEVIKRLYP